MCGLQREGNVAGIVSGAALGQLVKCQAGPGTQAGHLRTRGAESRKPLSGNGLHTPSIYLVWSADELTSRLAKLRTCVERVERERSCFRDSLTQVKDSLSPD